MNDQTPQRIAPNRRVLVVGVYLSDRPTLYPEISAAFNASKAWGVDKRWACLGSKAPHPDDARVRQHITERIPKFTLINQLLSGVGLGTYDYIVVCDDDIVLPAGFVDRYLHIVEKRGFDLSQPARTHESYTDHYFVNQLLGIESRQTRFVEIGPMFVLSRNAFAALLPLDEASPMGWGCDFVWPVLCEASHLTLGIVDAVPITHNLRKPVAFYSYEEAHRTQHAFLSTRKHLPADRAFFSSQAYPEEESRS